MDANGIKNVIEYKTILEIFILSNTISEKGINKDAIRKEIAEKVNKYIK